MCTSEREVQVKALLALERQVAILKFQLEWTRNDIPGVSEGESASHPWWDWYQVVAQRGTILGYWEWAYEQHEADREREWRLDEGVSGGTAA